MTYAEAVAACNSLQDFALNFHNKVHPWSRRVPSKLYGKAKENARELLNQIEDEFAWACSVVVHFVVLNPDDPKSAKLEKRWDKVSRIYDSAVDPVYAAIK